MSDTINTIARNGNILPEDKRVVFSKYDARHLLILEGVIKETRPELPIVDVTEYINTTIKNAMSKRGIAMYVDSTMLIFDMIWDTLTENEKETLNDHSDEHRDATRTEADAEV